MFHRDRGSQYASNDFCDLFNEYGITVSMSRRGDSTLAYVSPMKFEQDWLANQPRQVNS